MFGWRWSGGEVRGLAIPTTHALPKERMPVNLVVKSYAKAKSRYALSSINQHDR